MTLKVNLNNLGRCYELSFKYQQRNPEWKLIHGYITNKFPPFQIIDHAWCMKNGIIHDEIFEADIEEKIYKALFDFKIEKEYTYEEAMVNWEKSNGLVVWYEISNFDNDKFYDENGRIKEEYK